MLLQEREKELLEQERERERVELLGLVLGSEQAPEQG